MQKHNRLNMNTLVSFVHRVDKKIGYIKLCVKKYKQYSIKRNTSYKTRVCNVLIYKYVVKCIEIVYNRYKYMLNVKKEGVIDWFGSVFCRSNIRPINLKKYFPINFAQYNRHNESETGHFSIKMILSYISTEIFPVKIWGLKCCILTNWNLV